MYPTDYRYTKEHEWVKVSGDTGTIGITDYAQHELGDVVFVEMPAVGAKIDGGASIRHRGIGQGGQRNFRSRIRRSDGNQRRTFRHSRNVELGSARRWHGSSKSSSPVPPKFPA